MSEKDGFRLSRRRALGALGTIGLASAGAGMGTTALFNDSESTSGTFTAGKLNLKIGWEVSHYGNNVDPDMVEPRNTDGEGLGIQLRDVKPGDKGWIRFEILNLKNPAWVWFRGRLKGSKENGQTEPEKDAEGDDTDGYGELDENLKFRSFYDQNQNATVGDGSQTGNLWNDRYIQKPLDLDEVKTKEPQKGSIPVLLDGVRDGDSPDVVGGAYPEGEPIDPFGNGTSQYVTVRWSLPKEVGNEVQSDKITVCFDFYSEQSRHNPNGRFRGTNEDGEPVTSDDDKYPTNPWEDEYAGDAFDSLAEQDVILGPHPDNGQGDSSA